jgi:ankyrin repeat protein
MNVTIARVRVVCTCLTAGLVMASTLFAAALSPADQSLMDAAKQGDREAVRSLLNGRSDVNAAEPDGSTALLWAVHRQDLEMADLLIRAGANVDAANDYGVTGLSLACTNRNAALVNRLLEANANPNAALWTGETPLMTCSRTGSAEAVKALLARGANPNAQESQKGQTALMWAAANKRSDVVQLLIAGGADIRVRSKVTELSEPFQAPCTPDDPCLTGRTQGSTYPDTVHFPKAEGGFTPLLFAAQQGDIESARALLAAGADVNDSTTEEGTALVIASASGNEKFAIFLLENGANPNAKDGFGVTPLHYALHNGMLAVSSAKPQPTDAFGWVRPNMPDLVKALLDHGADPNAKIASDFPPYDYAPISRSNGNFLPQISLVGATPFFLAAASRDLDMMRFLVERRADPRLPAMDGVTPLMVAAGMAHERGGVGFGGNVGVEYTTTADQHKRILDAVKMAVDLGADVNAVNEWRGQTAMHAATFMGYTEVIEFLASKGADLNAKDKYGQTPMTIALGDPEGFVYRQLGGARYDYSFRQPKEQKSVAELLLKLGAAPWTGKRRDRSGE